MRLGIRKVALGQESWPLDFVTLGGSLIEMAGAILVIYLLRKQRRRIIIGLGGSLLLLGLTLLGIAYGLISGILVWIPTGLALILLVGFSYIVLRPQNAQPQSGPTR